jgi:CheY-like chemotaxis protein/anti-sigma regulatory factor (Ser/Thr protein kinase)
VATSAVTALSFSVAEEAFMTQFDVLVVDDDDATRSGLSALLTDAGFRVDVASDGVEALDKIARNDFRVVLLDVRLPRIGGLDILARCSSKPRPPKVIVITGVDTTEVVLGALRQRAYDFLPKPIEPSRLIEVVRRAVSVGPNVAAIEVLSARPEWVELLVPCTREAVERIQSFLQQLETDLPDDTRDSVGLAFRELLLNGIEWGGQLDPAQKVRVACLRTRRMLLYRIADPGPGFTFDELSHAAVPDAAGVIAHEAVRDAKGLRPGGFGLVLIRAIADELLYNEQRNEVVFVKYLDEPYSRQVDDDRKRIDARSDGSAM